jgi:cytosine/adenosine deaminase-related metal-dependent hydrolase
VNASAPGICFINAAPGEAAGSLRVVGDRIVAIDGRPARGDCVVDLAGDRLLPGLVNAHDHLQFNNFAPTRYREVHANVGEWIVDVTANRGRDAVLDAAEALALETRMLAGGIKNLLSGVTTVAHHGSFHATFEDFPVRVVRNYGWAHSLGLASDGEVRDSYQRTPASWPWIIHAGEGVDAAAAAELARLDHLGCLGARSVLVHAVGFRGAQQDRLIAAGAAVVWCPASNLFLFARTLDPGKLLAAGRLGLGSDSRLSGANDLLAELRCARAAAPACAVHLEALVTRHNARLLRLGDRGVLTAGALADLTILPAGMALAGARRADLRMVMLGGVMRYGDAAYASALGPHSNCGPVDLDGVPKVLDRALVLRLRRSGYREPGLAFANAEWRAA